MLGFLMTYGPIVLLVAAMVLTVWTIAQGSWWPAALGALAATVAAVGLVIAMNAPREPVERRTYEPAKEFVSTVGKAESWFGPAVSPATVMNGYLTQCFKRGCLQHFPEQQPEYRVQATLLGTSYLEKRRDPEQPIILMELPSVVTRWLADQRQQLDLLQLMGQPLRGAAPDDEAGCMTAVWQRAVLCWPEGTNDPAMVRLMDLGDWQVSLPAEVPWWAASWLRVALLGVSMGLAIYSGVQGWFSLEGSGRM